MSKNKRRQKRDATSIEEVIGNYAKEETYDSYSQTVQRSLLLLLTVAMFCMITILDAKDSALLGTGGPVKIPLIDASVSFVGFMAVGPVLLVVIVSYLHVFYGY